METLKELLGLKRKAKEINLETFSGKSIPSKTSILYLHKSLDELMNTAQKQIDAQMKKISTKINGDIDFQNVYLGYSPSRDLFVQGYDGWGTRPNDFDELGEDPDAPLAFKCSPYIVFKLEDDGDIDLFASGIDASREEKVWYSSGLKQFRRKFSDLLDLRSED